MKLRPFELALVIIFGGLAMGSLIILKFYQPSAKTDESTLAIQIGKVDIWGTLPSAAINSLLTDLSKQDDQYRSVSYQYYQPEEFDDILVTALADGRGPDIILVSHEKLIEMRQRIRPVAYESFPLRDFKNNYVDGAEIFALSDGIYGYPVAIDPLMVYWNKDILATEGFLEAPKTWEELVNDMFPKIIKRDFDRTINRSVVAMGEYGNVRNAFGIVSALLIQQGTKGVTEDPDGKYLVRINRSENERDPLLETADFYTRFSKPSNTLYSWNRAFEDDRLQFIGEDLALYFGYASEASEIERANPNLNFDIAEIPQGETATVRRTYGKFYAMSLLKSSENVPSATAVILSLVNSKNSEQIAKNSGMVPAFRSLVTQGSNDTFGRISYKSAGIALGWLNPDLAVTNGHFETMMRDINENRQDVSGATSDLLTRLRNEY
jgi:ABC-type glycerol-3-phosphate transport system substrate-binding protein